MAAAQQEAMDKGVMAVVGMNRANSVNQEDMVAVPVAVGMEAVVMAVDLNLLEVQGHRKADLTAAINLTRV